MGKISRNEVKKMWYVFTMLLLLTVLELGVSITQPFNENTMKWGLIVLITAKVLYTLSYFIYLKTKKEKIHHRNVISFITYPSFHNDCDFNGKRCHKHMTTFSNESDLTA